MGPRWRALQIRICWRIRFIGMMPNAMPWKELGLAIGHATDSQGATGCTVIRGIDSSFRCAAHLLGRASGTRELVTCDPEHLVDRTDDVMLTGGSAYGLDATAGGAHEVGRCAVRGTVDPVGPLAPG